METQSELLKVSLYVSFWLAQTIQDLLTTQCDYKYRIRDILRSQLKIDWILAKTIMGNLRFMGDRY
jgi:hypothetical protein